MSTAPRTRTKIGDRFGQLVVTELVYIEYPTQRVPGAICACDCGNTSEPLDLRHLRSGAQSSCGHLVGNHHGLSHHPLYGTWHNMVQRCHNPEHKSYPDYGARGVTVCPEWRDNPRAFIEYVEANLGPRPDGHTLDRIKNNRGYLPGNVRWADWATQAQNRRTTRLTSEIADEIRRLYATGQYTQRELAEKFDTDQPRISAIVRGVKWKEKSDQQPVPRRPREHVRV
jgi:predicted XRE-type DNA-binding protein